MRTLVHLACVMLSMACAAKPFRAIEEKIPPEVQESTIKLVAAYLGPDKQFHRIPLLDSRTDWNSFKNWPDRFRFRGESYRLRILQRGLGDPHKSNNRKSIKAGIGFSAWYGLSNHEKPGFLDSSASWSADGTLTYKTLSAGGQIVFRYRYYPSGHLFSFTRTNPEDKTHRTDYYDINGRRRGRRDSSARDGFRCEWDGSAVELELLQKSSTELFYAAFTTPFATTDEKIPPAVRQIVARQIEGYLGDEQFPNIPVLDTTEEWNLFRNWPDEFVFHEMIYRLRLTRIDGDVVSKIDSRQMAGPGVSFLANYEPVGHGENRGLRPSAFWTKDGLLHEKTVDLDGKRIFAFTFYPHGELFQFGRDDFETKAHSVEYFDQRGRLCGKFAPTPDDPNRHLWKGRRVPLETWEKEMQRLWKLGGGTVEE